MYILIGDAISYCFRLATATQIGTVFIARGVGAVFGAIFSSKLYMWFHGTHVMAYSLLLIMVVLITLPFNQSKEMLHVYFMLLGLGTSVTDTGCQIMTRKIHGKDAGPWLGGNTVLFGIAGALVPIIEILTTSVLYQYFILATIVAIVAIMIIVGPNPESGKLICGSSSNNMRSDETRPAVLHYYVEIVISIMVFCFIGGKVTTTAYLSTYVLQTRLLSTHQGSVLILVLWLSITVGRLAGVQDQRYLTNKTLPIHLSVLCLGGFLSMLLIMRFPQGTNSLWIGFAFYGLFNGPCVGYCYDLNNRITYPTEISMSIVMFGLNFGAAFVPYITTLIWNQGAGPQALIITTLLSMAIPLPLLWTTKFLSYDPAINPLIRNGYQAISDKSVDDTIL